MAILDVNRPKDKPLRAYPDIPPDIHEKLKARAKKHYRSVKAEITAIVEEVIIREEQDQSEKIESVAQ